MNTGTLVLFFALTFGLTWGLAALLILFATPIEAIFGAVSSTNPLFILAVYSPAFAALFLVWRTHGLKGLGGYLCRLALWRMPIVWWVFLVVGIPAVYYAGAAIKGSIADPFPFSPGPGVISALAIALFIGPIEELGWRGLALPLLQRKLAPFWAGLVLGVIWAGWHLPAFVIGGTPQSGWSFPTFFLGVVALSVIMTPMFNAAGGSLLVAAVFHFQCNVPVWPDAQPWDTVIFAFVAGGVVWLNRRNMFCRGSGVTRVLMPDRRKSTGIGKSS